MWKKAKKVDVTTLRKRRKTELGLGHRQREELEKVYQLNVVQQTGRASKEEDYDADREGEEQKKLKTTKKEASSGSLKQRFS